MTCSSGDISLSNGSRIKGGVINKSGKISIERSSIDKTLEISAHMLNIGANSNINHMYLKTRENNHNHYSSGVNRGWAYWDSETFANSINGRVHDNINFSGVKFNDNNYQGNRATGQNAAPPQKKVITLEGGSVVNSLTFDGEECTVILKAGARFNGDRNMPGLTIQKA